MSGIQIITDTGTLTYREGDIIGLWVNTCPYSGAHALAIYTRYDTTTMGTKELDVKFPSGTGFPAHESEMEHWAALTAMKFMANVVHYGRK